MAVEERMIEVDGATLFARVEGDGPPVLLVHGFPDDHSVWRQQIGSLVSAGYRVIAIDTRGCGQSSAPAARADYRIEKLVSDLVGVLDAFGIERVQLVGHDWGAVIGWQFCLAHPERVDRYVALSVGHPGAFARAPIAQKLKSYYVWLFQIRGLAERFILARQCRVLARLAGKPDEAVRWHEKLSRSGRATAALNYYRANLALLVSGGNRKARVPTMGVWSDRDAALTRAQMENSAAYMGAPWRFEVIENTSHWLQLEAPDRINALLLDYLEGNVS